MADLSEVETALAGMATSAIYPLGVARGSVVGIECRVYRGWPLPAALNSDLRAGLANVTVFPSAERGQVTTRFPSESMSSPQDPTMGANVSALTVTFSGTAAQGQTAGVLVDGETYVYRVQDNDDSSLVAANIAAQLSDKRIVSLHGSSITVPGANSIVGRVVVDSISRKEIRRQSHTFHIACWCPTPDSRDRMSIAIDQSMSQSSFLSLPDGSSGKVTYEGTTVLDRAENALLYRRDLMFLVEYPTVIMVSEPAMIFGEPLLNSELRVG